MASFEEILEMKEKNDIKNLILNLKNDNKDIRAFIAQTLGDIGDKNCSVFIFPLLDDESKKVRKEAAMALGLINNVNSVKPLTKALKDDSEDVRQIAAFSLIRIGDANSLTFLKEVLNDESENVREIAALGVEAFENKGDIDLNDQLIDYGEKLQLNIKPKSFLRTPPEIVEIISTIAYNSHPTTVFDPACGKGSLISGLRSKLEGRSKLFCSGMNKEFFEKNEEIKGIKLIYDDFFKFKEKTNIKFDFIVSDMFIYTINPENITKKNINFKIALLLDSLELLNKNGRLIFLIPDNFLNSDEYLEAYYRWRRSVMDGGIHIDPDCALDIFERLGARTLVPIHWGTVHLPFGLPGTPRRRLAKVAHERGKAERVRVLAHGESLGLARA